MFIIERLFGVGVYAACLLLVCLLISKKNSKYKRILGIYCIALALMGFFYVPYETSDLYRIYEYLDWFKNMDFGYFINRFSDSSTIVSHLYYWLIAQTGINNLLPFVNSIICYSCIFYTFAKTADIYKIERKHIAISLLFYMSVGNYMFVITGIRTMLALSLIWFCFFRETVEKKFNVIHIILYILAAFIHNFAVIIILIRFISPLFKKGIFTLKRFIYFLVLIIGITLSTVFLDSLLETVFGRAEGYITDSEMYSYGWEYLLGSLVILASLLVLISVRKKYVHNGEFSQIKIFSVICILISLCLCFEFTIFHRLTTYTLAISITPLMMIFLKNSHIKNKEFLVAIFSLLMLFIACWRGSLCSLKFFEI